MAKLLSDYVWPASERRWPARLRAAACGFAFHLTYAAARMAGLIRKRRPLLVIRTDGIGDAILFEPTLRQYAGDTKASLWFAAPAGELFRHHASVDRVVDLPRGFKAGNLAVRRSMRCRIRLAWLLGSQRFDRAIYPAHSAEPLGNWLITSVLANERTAVAGDLNNQFDWQQKRTLDAVDIVKSTHGTHELERNASLVGSDARTPDFSHVPQIDPAWQSVSLRASKAGFERIIALMPGASMSINCYPIPQWVQIIRSIATRHRVGFLLLGGSADDERLRAIESACGDCVLRPSSASRLVDVANLIRRCDGMVTIDTGLAHLAVSLGVPTVVLVIGGHPGRFFPWPIPTRSVALTEPVPCAGCANRCIHPTAICLDQITPDRVIRAVEGSILSPDLP
jgi:ADP-heptose:LPS heptosyltransferase